MLCACQYNLETFFKTYSTIAVSKDKRISNTYLEEFNKVKRKDVGINQILINMLPCKAVVENIIYE